MSEHHHHSKNALTLAFWLNTVFSVIEIVGGMYTNSSAILTDAIHDMGDSLAIGLGILFEKIAGKKPDARYTYGYKRFSLVSALMLSVLLIAGAVAMVVKAVGSFANKHEVNSEGMFVLAVLGVVVNGIAFLRIKQSGKQNHNSKAIMLHFLEDVLGWVAVLVGSMVIYVTGWNWIDGVLSIGIAVFIGWNATRNLTETIPVFLQAAPVNINVEQLRQTLLVLDGVLSVEALHVWSLDDNETIGTVQIVYRKGIDYIGIQQAVFEVFVTFNISRPVVQLKEEQLLDFV